ncbi:unnamed protein product [Amaranthus hypochondriacus]
MFPTIPSSSPLLPPFFFITLPKNRGSCRLHWHNNLKSIQTFHRSEFQLQFLNLKLLNLMTSKYQVRIQELETHLSSKRRAAYSYSYCCK